MSRFDRAVRAFCGLASMLMVADAVGRIMRHELLMALACLVLAAFNALGAADGMNVWPRHRSHR